MVLLAPEAGAGGNAGMEAELARARAELGSLRGQERHLRAANAQLRAELRRARPAVAIAGALHEDLLASGHGAGDVGAGVGVGDAVPLPPVARKASLEEALAVFAEDSEAFAEDQAELRVASVRAELLEMQSANEQLQTEVAGLRERLAAQASLEAQAVSLMEALHRTGRQGSPGSSLRGLGPGPAVLAEEETEGRCPGESGSGARGGEEEPEAAVAPEIGAPKVTSRPTARGLPRAPPTARQAQLAQECAKLRLWLSDLETEVAKRRAALPAAPATLSALARAGAGMGGSGRRARNEVRRLRQVEVIAHGLHKELRRWPPQSSSVGAPTPPPSVLHAAAPGHAPCPSSTRTAPSTASAVSSLRSECLERHVDDFCRRFALRRSGLAAN
mmetsp:Transcript_129717/g.361297  ORF Transcript_129717/g.361297 Transcript_129717/m.361297 type:complete len:389 (+) Transcript_129717:95-1261(+)